MNWPFSVTESLLFEALYINRSGNFNKLTSAVVEIAITKGLYPVTLKPHAYIADYTIYLHGSHKQIVPELIRELMWKLLVKGLIVFGKDVNNPNWPDYTITGLGDQILDGKKPQPYDPDNFLQEFKSEIPLVDSVIYDYLDESVRTFNSGCLKASAVMLGAASEKAIFLLLDSFSAKISDTAKKSRFDRDVKNQRQISPKFDVLLNRLSLMANGNKFSRELKVFVNRDLPGMFDLVRRLRNTAGHPELLFPIREDSMFLNLRVFTEYMKGIYALLGYFSTNDADW